MLDRIVARKLEEVAALPDLPPPARVTTRGFARALRREDGAVAVIAEIKHASPSKGVLIEPFDPVMLARTYQSGGAAALSVLTDRDFFQGSLDDLRAARAEVALPVLRKDFTIDVRQIIEAARAGADAILLIAAILDDARLRDLHDAARGCGLDALVEVHDEAELDRALELGAPLVGVNNRDLHTFQVNLDVTRRLAARIPPDRTLVAESGIFTRGDVERMAAAGAHAVLVGESLVKAPDIAAQLRALVGVKRIES
ncbi:MAG: indole-3-glycerol phosphate synthase TrpC [Anaerolineae bacterium]|nr:indole-3-glycerol phosphate synthase TrpC [Anaerolineae bacterium]